MNLVKQQMMLLQSGLKRDSISMTRLLPEYVTHAVGIDVGDVIVQMDMGQVYQAFNMMKNGIELFATTVETGTQQVGFGLDSEVAKQYWLTKAGVNMQKGQCR